MNRPVRGTNTAIRSKTIAGRNLEKPKTLSYTQLKEENSVLHKQNADLEHKFSRQSHALSVLQRNAKGFEKENKTLRELLDSEQQQHAEYIECASKEWASQKGILTDKLSRCERKLEVLGVDPVTLENCSDREEEDKSKREALARAEILRERLTENITSSQFFLQKIKEISMQSREALKQLES